MGCGMKLFLIYLVAPDLKVLALIVVEQFKRWAIIITLANSSG